VHRLRPCRRPFGRYFADAASFRCWQRRCALGTYCAAHASPCVLCGNRGGICGHRGEPSRIPALTKANTSPISAGLKCVAGEGRVCRVAQRPRNEPRAVWHGARATPPTPLLVLEQLQSQPCQPLRCAWGGVATGGMWPCSLRVFVPEPHSPLRLLSCADPIRAEVPRPHPT
jgi:hypothetical protein